MIADNPETEIAHRWQNFRERCITLAIKSGATDKNMIEVAEIIGKYIITKSGAELHGKVKSDEA